MCPVIHAEKEVADMNMLKLKDGCKCLTCYGCSLLEAEGFKGRMDNCRAYEKADTKITFIDKTIDKWRQEKLQAK